LGADLVSNLMGFVSAVHVTDSSDQRDFRVGHLFISLLQTGRHKRKRILGHLKHLWGPIWWIGPLNLPIELGQ